MKIDPTYQPYLDEVLATRSERLHLVDVKMRRAKMKELRAHLTENVPPSISVETFSVGIAQRNVRIRVTRPAGRSSGPAILYCHGGGWMYGSPEQSAELAHIYTVNVGAIVVSPEYRLSPENPFPAAFDDCIGVLNWMFAEGQSMGIDPSRIAVAGESSGANLAAACALEYARLGRKLRLQVLNYPALDTNFETSSYRQNEHAPVLCRDEMIYFWNAYLSSNVSLADARARPLLARSFLGSPPAHIIVAEYDPLRDEGIAYAQKLSASGIKVTLINGEGLTHGFFRAVNQSRTVKKLAAEICSALREAFESGGNARASCEMSSSIRSARRV